VELRRGGGVVLLHLVVQCLPCTISAGLRSCWLAEALSIVLGALLPGSLFWDLW
jgi:hypothetical protein